MWYMLARSQKTEDLEVGGGKAEVEKEEALGRRQKTEDRRQKTETDNSGWFRVSGVRKTTTVVFKFGIRPPRLSGSG